MQILRIHIIGCVAVGLVLATAACVATGGESTYRVIENRVFMENPGGMPALCRAGNGDLLFAHATNWQPVPPAGGTVKLTRSTDEGRTWSQAEVMIRPKEAAWSVHQWSGLHLMPDSSLIMSHGQNLSETVAEAYVMRSTDHGKTWGSAWPLVSKDMMKFHYQEIPFLVGLGRPASVKNGQVLVPVLPRKGSQGFYGTKAAGFVRTSDHGKTWGPMEFIASGPQQYNETSLGVARNGDLVAIVRRTSPRRLLWLTRSVDQGRTWSEPVPTKVASGGPDWGGDYQKNQNHIWGKMPDMLVLASGRMLLAVGSVNLADGADLWNGPPRASYAGLFVSDDHGATWRRDAGFTAPNNLIPYDCPVLTVLKNGDVLAVQCAYDPKYKDHADLGQTLGFHYVINVLREVRDECANSTD